MAEYEGKRTPGLPFPILPRPLVNTMHRQRAENLTGDPNGLLPPDPNKSFWHGGDRVEGDLLAAQLAARIALDEAILEAWY